MLSNPKEFRFSPFTTADVIFHMPAGIGIVSLAFRLQNTFLLFTDLFLIGFFVLIELSLFT